MRAQVLVVEADAELCTLLERDLVHDGQRVTTANTGAHALHVLAASAIDLVVLNRELPDVPGDEVLRAVLASGTPAIVTSIRGELDHRLRGLEMGADDYLVKPFSPRELVLRVRAVLHRTYGSPHAPVRRFGAGRLTIDTERHEVTVEGALVHLTPHEWQFLTALASHPGRVFSRHELVYLMHGFEFPGYERSVDTHMKNLRKKLGDSADEPRLIDTVRGIGYRLLLRADD